MFLEAMKKAGNIDLPLSEIIPHFFLTLYFFSVNCGWICRYDLNETSSITRR